MSTLLTWALALLLLPVLVLAWALETPHDRARRWRRAGCTYAHIAARLGVSPSTARRWCLS